MINPIIHDNTKNVPLARLFLPLVVLNITIMYSKGYCKITEPFCFSVITVTLLLFTVLIAVHFPTAISNVYLQSDLL